MELTKTRPAKAYIGMMNSYLWKNATLRLLLAAAVMLVPSLAQADQLLHGTPIGTTAIQYETLEPSDTENTIHNVFDGDYDTFRETVRHHTHLFLPQSRHGRLYDPWNF